MLYSYARIQERHLKGVMCSNEIGIHAYNLLTIQSSIVYLIGGGVPGDLYDHIMRIRIFTWIMNKIFISSQEIRVMEMRPFQL